MMSTRRKLLGLSAGLGTCIASGNFLRMFSQNSDTKTDDISTEPVKRQIVLEDYELKQVQIFIRHGARTPIHLMKNVEQVTYDRDMFLSTVPHTTYNYKVMDMDGQPRPESKYDNYLNKQILKGGSVVGALTTLGQDQMFVIGRLLAQQYIDEAQLIDGTFNPDTIFVRSTNVNRTIETARCVLAGMFTHQQLNNLTDTPVIHVAHTGEDELVPGTANCHVLRQINHAAMIHGCDLPGLKEDKLQLETALGIAGEPNNKTNFIFVRDDIVARETHGLSVPRWVSPIRQMIEDNASLVMYYAFCGQHEAERDLAIRLSSGPLITMVLDTIEKAEQSKTKLYLNSCHDSTLVGMQGLLDLFDHKWPPFGSDIRFELYEHRTTKENYVRISYNGQDKVVRGCTSAFCPVEEFRTAMKPYVIEKQTYKQLCSSNILNEIAQEMMKMEEGEVEDEDSKQTSDTPAGM